MSILKFKVFERKRYKNTLSKLLLKHFLVTLSFFGKKGSVCVLNRYWLKFLNVPKPFLLLNPVLETLIFSWNPVLARKYPFKPCPYKPNCVYLLRELKVKKKWQKKALQAICIQVYHHLKVDNNFVVLNLLRLGIISWPDLTLYVYGKN